MKVVASALSDQGLRREGNEDQYLIDESLGLYVVCDGMGGHAAGEVAAERAIGFASEHIAENSEVIESAHSSPDGYYRVLKIAEEAVQTASLELFQLAKSTPEYAGMGTTMTLLVIVENKAVMAHVGDSRLYLLRGGEVHQLSVDHTLANELYMAGGMTNEEAARSRYRHVLTRSIGPHESVMVDTLLFDLMPGDRFLICSDGLSNYFDDPATVARFLAEPRIVEKPDTLIDFAKRAGGDDNITAIIVQTLAESEEESLLDNQSKLDAIRGTFLCRNLSVGRLLHVVSITATIHCAEGSELISMNAKCGGMYIVLDGSFRVLDDDIVEGELGPGDHFGEAALMSATQSPATLIAVRPSRVVLIDRRQFTRLTRRLPRLGNALLRNLSRHLSQKVAQNLRFQRPYLDDTGPLP